LALNPGLVHTGDMSGTIGPGSKLSTLTSTDTPEPILAFYRDQLKAQFGEDAYIQETPVDASEAQLMVAYDNTMVVIMITVEGTGSSVAITTMTAPS
jgi:hypothetical protein